MGVSGLERGIVHCTYVNLGSPVVLLDDTNALVRDGKATTRILLTLVEFDPAVAKPAETNNLRIHLLQVAELGKLGFCLTHLCSIFFHWFDS